MKKALKILTYFLLSIIFIIISLFLTAEYAENKVTSLALSRLNKAIKAPLQIENVSFSLLHSFPLATITFDQLCMGSPTDSSALSKTNGDTLVYIKKLFISVKVMPIFDEEFEMTKIEMVGANINYAINKNGIGSFDFLMDTATSEIPDTVYSKKFYDLKKLSLEDVSIRYFDSTNATKAQLLIPEMEIKGKLIDSAFTASAKGNLKLFNCHYDSTNIHLMNELTVSLDMNFADNELIIDELSVAIDKSMIDVKGKVIFNDTLYTELAIETGDIELSEVIKYLPSEMLSDNGLKYISGNLKLKAAIKGSISDSIVPQVDMDAQFKNGNLIMTGYPALKNISFTSQINNGKLANNKTTHIAFQDFQFSTPHSNAKIDVTIDNIDHPKYDVKAYLNVSLTEIKPFLPKALFEQLEGNIIANIATKGQMPAKMTDDFIEKAYLNTSASVDLKNVNLKIDSVVTVKALSGNITYQPTQLTASNINGSFPDYHLTLTNNSFDANITGKPTQLKTLGIQLKSLIIGTDSCRLITSGYIQNLEKPYYNLKGDLNLNLNEIKQMLPDSLVDNMHGTIHTSFSSAAILNLDSIDQQINEIIFEKSQFEVQISNVLVNLHKNNLSAEINNGQLSYQNDTIEIRQLKGKILNMDFSTNKIALYKAYNSYFLNNKDTIKFRGNIDIGDIDYTFLTSNLIDDKTNTASVESEIQSVATDPKQNYTYDAKGIIQIKSFKYQNSLFQNISTKYHVTEQIYLLDQFKFDAFKGNTNTSVKIENYPNNRTKIFFKNQSNNIDLKQLLSEFDDFKEFGYDEYITHDQISGTFSTQNLNGYLLWKDSLIIDSIALVADLKLSDGVLTQYPVAVQMGKDYDIDGLDNLQFKTIDTKLFVLTNIVYIPSTMIKSNVFDIGILGKQNFNLDCQYHLRFYLKEILRKGKTDRIERLQTNKNKQSQEGASTGLRSLYAIYKVQGGATVKSAIETSESNLRKEMIRFVLIKEKDSKLNFNPIIIKYDILLDENF